MKNHPNYGLIAHPDVNTYATSARMYVTIARMSMIVNGRGEQEGNLERYWNLRICKLYIINYNFFIDYWDTAFCN